MTARIFHCVALRAVRFLTNLLPVDATPFCTVFRTREKARTPSRLIFPAISFRKRQSCRAGGRFVRRVAH
jgi:hypothetical protein